MRGVYVTIDEPLSVAAWSGLNRYIAQALIHQRIELDFVGPLHDRYWVAKKLRWRAGAALGRRRYIPDRSHWSARSYAHQVEHRLANIETNPEFIFSTGTIPIAFLRSSRPIAFWTDANFAAMVEFYPSYSSLSARTLAAGHELERRALDVAALAIYSSDWAAASAVTNYGADPARVAVVPFGPNLDATPAPDDVEGIVSARPSDQCRLLFLAVDWERKGGHTALEAARILNDRGVATKLTVVGCEPPNGGGAAFVECRPFISKTTNAGRAELAELLRRSHFLIHPARADATPVALPESCAFAVPVLASSVGGIPTIIRDGRNGYLLPPNATAEMYAALAEELMGDRKRYDDLALSTYREFQARLNWEVAGAAVAARLKLLL